MKRYIDMDMYCCVKFFNIIIALAIGIVFSRTKELIFFLSMYIPLRSFCGGWHANKIWKCTVISNAILLLQVYGLEKLLSHLSIGTMLLMFFLNMICIFYCTSRNRNEKNQSSRKTYLQKKNKINIYTSFNYNVNINIR